MDFVLVGGYAAVLHGSTAVTRDIDICAAITEGEVAKLRAALKDLHPRHRMYLDNKPSFLDTPADLSGVNNIYLETDLGVLDVLSSTQPAGSFREIRSRAATIPLYGYICKVISLDDLIVVKDAMSRPKDAETAHELRRIREIQKS